MAHLCGGTRAPASGSSCGGRASGPAVRPPARHAFGGGAWRQVVAATSHVQSLQDLPARSSVLAGPAARPGVAARASALGELVFVEGYVEVDRVMGSRVVMDGENPKLEYLVKWKDSKDGAEISWEEAINLSDDVVRDYDDKWWAAATKCDLEAMAKMLAGGKDALPMVVDENGRSALHFAAARGNLDCVKMLVEAGADPDLQDKDGYTPLHMAAGYMAMPTMAALLEAGSNPQLKDNSGKDVVGLIGNLRAQMPLSPMTVQRRIALEQVASVLTDKVYEEVEPAKILNARRRDDGSREFLVSFEDGADDEWVDEADVAPDVIEDWDAGVEYAAAREVVDVVQVGTERRFKVVWEDEYPASWEPEEHLQPDLIKLFQQQNPQLFQQRVEAAADAGEREWPASDADWEAAARTAEDHVDGAQRDPSGAYRSQSERIFVGPA